jgi:hypothetical protein
MNHRVRVIIIAALIAVALYAVIMGAIYGLTQFEKPRENISEKKADISITSEQLQQAFETNEQNANTTYLNKVIEVSGPVGSISMNQDNAPVITLRKADKDVGVLCTIIKKEIDKIKSVREGQEIKLKGLCTGYNGMDMLPGDVVLIDCSLVE